MLKHETEKIITYYLKQQGLTACKRFKVKKDGNLTETKTLLLTFNTTSLPKSLKKITELYQLKFTFQILCGVSTVSVGHHENSCPVPDGSVCKKCGMGDFDQPTHTCKNQAKCVNCNKSHF